MHLYFYLSKCLSVYLPICEFIRIYRSIISFFQFIRSLDCQKRVVCELRRLNPARDHGRIIHTAFQVKGQCRLTRCLSAAGGYSKRRISAAWVKFFHFQNNFTHASSGERQRVCLQVQVHVHLIQIQRQATNFNLCRWVST